MTSEKKTPSDLRANPSDSRSRGVRKDRSTPANREFWDHVGRAAARVSEWPAWKRGIGMDTEVSNLGPETKHMCQVPESDPQFGLMVVMAFRYALGRSTYVSLVVPAFVRRNASMLSNFDLKQMADEAKQAVEKDRAGMDVDKKEWLLFASWCEAELRNRGDSSD